MRLPRTRFSIWFSLKKTVRTSVAVGLFISGLMAGLNYIRAETDSVEQNQLAGQKSDKLKPLPGIKADLAGANQW